MSDISAMTGETLAPIVYVPHGGGPLPLLGHDGHRDLTQFLSDFAPQLISHMQKKDPSYSGPEAIVVISAHWETAVPKVTSSSNPELIYDYSGFPPESYAIKYPAPGSPTLAEKMVGILADKGIRAEEDPKRGYDHGVFVPLKLMYPNAELPVVQLSLYRDLDAKKHIELGEALAELRHLNVLIVGSGMSFHNMGAFFNPRSNAGKEREFNQWLKDILVSNDEAESARDGLINWQQGPHAIFCHPREEHLLPLHVCFGMAKGAPATTMFEGEVLTRQVLALLW